MMDSRFMQMTKKKKNALMYFSAKILIQPSFARFVLEHKALNKLLISYTGTKNKDTTADQHMMCCNLLQL